MSATVLLHKANHRMAVALLFEPRDLWFGVFWDTYWEGPRKELIVYVCILPMFPIRVSTTIRSLV